MTGARVGPWHGIGPVVLAAVLAAGPWTRSEAQARWELQVDAHAAVTTVTRAGLNANELNGPVLGAGVLVRFARVSLEAGYLEGQLGAANSALGAKETLAEASAVLRVAVGGGVTLGVGPRARAFIADGGTVRWMRTEIRGGWRGEVVPGRAVADVEVWQVLSGEVNAQGGASGGRGGTAGLALRLPNSPFTLRLAYTADRVGFANGASEFVDGITLGLRFGRF